MKLTTEISKAIDEIRTDPNDGRQSCFLHRLFESGLDVPAANNATGIDGDVLEYWRMKDSFNDAIDAVRRLYESELIQLANKVIRSAISAMQSMEKREIEAIIRSPEEPGLVELLREISSQKLPAHQPQIITGELIKC